MTFRIPLVLGASGSLQQLQSTDQLIGLTGVNAQSGVSYTFISGDIGKLVTFSNASSVAVTLPQASASFPSGWYINVQNRGVGTVTITPVTSTIDGGINISITTNTGIVIWSDGTNYYTLRGGLAGNQTITLSGDTTGSGATGITTTTSSVHGVAYPASPSINTVPVVTSSNTITYEALPNSAMALTPTLTIKGNNTGGSASPSDLTVAQVMTMLGAAPLASPTFTGTVAAPTVAITTNNTSLATTAAVTTALGNYVLSSLIGAASGIAALDGTGKVPTSQLPSSIVGSLQYQGVWNANINSPTLASGTGTKGYMYKVSVAGSTAIDGTSNWTVGDMIIFDGTVWDKIDGPAEAVTSVNGSMGAITGLATIASPTFTGVPAAPTATYPTNTTQIATTAYVTTAISSNAYVLPAATTSVIGGVSVPSGAGLVLTSGSLSLSSPSGALTGSWPNPTLSSGTVNALQQAINLTSAESSATISPGAAVYISGAGAVKRAQANASTTAGVLGLATAAITASSAGYIAPEGILTLTTIQWDTVVTGESGGLTAGAVYFLDPTTPGNLTTTAPSTAGSQFVVCIGRAISTTQLLINPQFPIQL